MEPRHFLIFEIRRAHAPRRPGEALANRKVNNRATKREKKNPIVVSHFLIFGNPRAHAQRRPGGRAREPEG